MSERAIPTKRHFDSLQCLTNALHKKSFYLGSPGSSSPDESTCLGLCAWPRWLYIPLLLPPLETGSRLSVETGNRDLQEFLPKFCQTLTNCQESSQVKVYSSRRQKSHMQRQWARLARRGWCAGVVPTAPRSLERIRREMRQAEPPARGGAAQASLGL